MAYRMKTGVLGVIALVLILIFVFYDVGTNWQYILEKRTLKVLAIVLTGAAIAFSTVVVQTITNNRLLTPNIMGLDALYLLIQTVIVFLFSSTMLTEMDKNIHFLMTVGIMVLFGLILFKLLFKKSGNNIYFLLLIGMIFGTFFGSFSSFMQVLIDPNEFLIVQDKMFASFNNIQTELLYVASVLIIL